MAPIPSLPLRRREFLIGAIALALPAARTRAQGDAASIPPVCIFSKHLQFLDYEALASTAKDLELDGLDLTVRNGGHVEPDRVREDLPRAVEAIRAEGLDVPMITTRLRTGGEPELEAVLETASELGIQYARVGGHSYDRRETPQQTLRKVQIDCERLAGRMAEHGMAAGYHNHSGTDRVGAPMWDLLGIYEAIDSPAFGANFDVGHATVEGPYGDCLITAKATAPFVRMVAIKDFVFDGRRPQWVPLGEGIVPLLDFLRVFEDIGFAGPISIHFEYGTPSNDALLDHMAAAVEHVRTTMRRAGYR